MQSEDPKAKMALMFKAADEKSLEPALTPAQDEARAERARADRLVGRLAALQEHRVSPTGRASPQKLAEALVDAAAALVGADVAVLLAFDREAFEWRVLAGRGVPPAQLTPLRVRPGEGLLGRVAQTGEPLASGDRSAPTPLPQEDFLSAPFWVLPLRIEARIAGLLAMAKPAQGAFQTRDRPAIELLAGFGGIVLENLALYQKNRRYYREMVETLEHSIEAKDPDTFAHSHRTGALVDALAAELHLPQLMVEQIEYGARLHDVGKIGIEDRILRKPDKLTPEEYDAMKKHPEIGYQILRSVPFLKGASTMVLYHQEWFNGHGYPEGLAGEEIPLGARLVSLIDAWDAMTSDRPYRKALSKSAATSELRRGAGTQFDAKLVDVFLRVLDRGDRDSG